MPKDSPEPEAEKPQLPRSAGPSRPPVPGPPLEAASHRAAEPTLPCGGWDFECSCGGFLLAGFWAWPGMLIRSRYCVQGLGNEVHSPKVYNPEQKSREKESDMSRKVSRGRCNTKCPIAGQARPADFWLLTQGPPSPLRCDRHRTANTKLLCEAGQDAASLTIRKACQSGPNVQSQNNMPEPWPVGIYGVSIHCSMSPQP